MQAVAETNHYMARAGKLLTDLDRDKVIEAIAADPLIGNVIEGTRGVRKVRFAKDGRGKSGGIRVIYYFYDETVPIILLTLFGKNEKDNLSKAERNALAEVVAKIKKGIRGKLYG